MEPSLPSFFRLKKEVAGALAQGLPVVALESTVITHGLPYPQNISLAQDMESEVRERRAVPATIGVLGGKICVGLELAEIVELAKGVKVHKISSRDFGSAILKGWDGGTTVAGTLLAAHKAGIQVFATGGIGGVHRAVSSSETPAPAAFSFDISADLPQLSRTPMVVVCAGAKAILDLHATLEYLETSSVPVVGYGTDEFPAFYSRSSGLKTSLRLDTPGEIAELARHHWKLGMRSAVLVVQPPPQEAALPYEDVETAVQQALQEAAQQDVRGQAVTPFLLQRVTELTGGASLQANLALLRNNARLAAEIARRLAPGLRLKAV